MSADGPHVVLIDNYDSFTWNIYEYLCREGAHVTVFRNDQTTVDAVAALQPNLVMISPGPGHPDTDSGISRDVIKHFLGKLPVFGVCMGLQCMVSMLGGTIEYAGEIVHGKTSAVSHNGEGVFAGVSQGVAATRYHSLAANITTLPDVLEVTARTESGVIMGVRHKEYMLEGVQFHPESIMSEEGRRMLRNFLNFHGGKRDAASRNAASAPALTFAPGGSILDKIYAQRRLDVNAAEQLPGQSLSHLETYLEMGLAPAPVSFRQRLLRKPDTVAVIAEVKRASPSKGSIDLTANAAKQAKTYADAGAAAISVLTEPHWFKGQIQDLRFARQAVASNTDRPAILLKDFVFSRYQIAEARLAGADAVLLIVKMLEEDLLRDLYAYAYKIGIEALVEVSNEPEMKRALALGAEVIGVNNRDLHTFSVDMSTTSSLVPDSHVNKTVFAALSGITGPEPVSSYKAQGIRVVLVGESLMRSSDPAKFVQSLSV